MCSHIASIITLTIYWYIYRVSEPNYNINPHRFTHYFDLESGLLVVGEKSLGTFFHQNDAQPETVHRLGELLLDKTIGIDPERYPRLDVSEWPDRRYLKFGQWLHSVVTPPEAVRTNLTHDVIDRAYHLGLGPLHKSIVQPKRFGSLTHFYDELELIGHAQPGWYDHWPRDWFADYVEDVFRNKPPDETLTQTIARLAHAGEGPSRDVILAHADRLLVLLEERGYADVRSWSFDDYINWNVMFRMSNDRKPRMEDLAYLGGINRKRGPSLKAVVGNCGSVSNFQAAADERYPETARAMELRLQGRIEFLERRHKKGPLLLTAMHSEKFPLWLKVRHSAQYQLVHALKPNLPEEVKETAALKIRQRDYLTAVENLAGRIDKISQLRQAARSIHPDIEQDIWPKHNPEHLYIPK
jgi:hypothetical protein